MPDLTKRTASVSPVAILLASIVIQLCLGGVYAWSTFVGPLRDQYGFTATQTQCIFGVTIATFTLVMIIAGRLLPRYGPRRITTIAGILFALGYGLAAASAGNYFLILLGIGILVGAGIGCGYACSLTTALNWYPHRRGLVIGLVVAGFGAGAVVLTTCTSLAFAHGIAVLHWFAWLAVGYGVVLLLCAQLLTVPANCSSPASATLSPPRFWGDFHFWSLVIGIFCGTFAGLLVIGNLKPIGLSWGMSAGVTTSAVSLFAVGNAAGRIGWGWLADRWDARPLIPLMLAVGAVSLSVWSCTAGGSAGAFLILVVLIAFFFGGCFVLFATQVTQRYGAESFPLIYPWVFLAYGLAALVGPMIGGWLYDILHDYRPATFIAAGTCGAGAIVVALMMRVRSKASAPVIEEVA